MTTTRYFAEQVLRKRPYLTLDLCSAVLANPLRREAQPDGRIRHWGEVTLPDETPPAHLAGGDDRGWRDDPQRLLRPRLP